MIEITLHGPHIEVHTTPDGVRHLTCIDASGIIVHLPLAAEDAKTIGEGLVGSQIVVAPASTLQPVPGA